MTTLRQARHSHFQRGSGVFNCTSCGRSTRVTHQSNETICAECWDIAGETNALSDNGELFDKNIAATLDQCVARGGSVEKLLREFPEVCAHIGWTGPAPVADKPVTTEAANFIVKVRSENGLSYEAPVAAADAKAAVRFVRDAVKLAGISRKVGVIHFRATKA